MRTACGLLLVIALAAGAGAQDAPFVYNIPVGGNIRNLPGAAALNPPKNSVVRSIAFTMTPVTFKLTTSLGEIVTFTGPSYINDATQQPLLFTPTMKGRPGDYLTATLSNNLIEPTEPGDESAWGYHNPSDTNLHTHGLHDETGVDDQATAQTSYTGGDNIFYVLKGRKTAAEPKKTVRYSSQISHDHMPGLHWHHPHKHGATTIQTATSKGAIVVVDNQWWFPWNRGKCGEVWSLMMAATDTIFDITLLFFKEPEEAVYNADPTYQQVSFQSVPQNPLCCNGTAQYPFTGLATQNGGMDILLLNGGYQPEIDLPADTWARWRFLFSASKGWIVLSIMEEDASTGELVLSNACEMQLLAKDGVYLMKVPRKIPGVILSASNRAELMVRCKAPAGKRLVLSSGNVDGFSSGGNTWWSDEVYRIIQPKLATIVITASQARAQQRAAARVFASRPAARSAPLARAAAAGPAQLTELVEESCTPRRPSYATDIRDEALVKAGYTGGIVQQGVVFGGQLINGVQCQVNGENFTFPDPNPLVMPLGKIVEWTYNVPRFHPIHVHVNPFQITWWDETQMQPNTTMGNYFKIGDWHDNLLIPQLGPDTPNGAPDNTIKFRFQPGNYTGYAVVHCHFLQHEDLGCMKVVKWECPGYGNVQPASGTCPGFKFPVKGDI